MLLQRALVGVLNGGASRRLRRNVLVSDGLYHETALNLLDLLRGHRVFLEHGEVGHRRGTSLTDESASREAAVLRVSSIAVAKDVIARVSDALLR